MKNQEGNTKLKSVPQKLVLKQFQPTKPLDKVEESKETPDTTPRDPTKNMSVDEPKEKESMSVEEDI